MSEQLPEFLTAAEVAARFRVTTQTVYRWIEAGRLRAWRPGGRNYLITSESVSEMLTRDGSCGILEA